ncbi:MAG: glycosyltransferase family 39 protein [Planctomycetota bacterium]
MTPKSRLALAGILLLALGLRLGGLESKSLWLDEAWTWAYTQKPFVECVTSEYSNPPGSFAIFWAGVRLLDDGERGLRFPSALSGVLATWLLFRLGRRLFDEPTALLASLLLAASAFHLRFTQEARTYGFLACAALASTEAVVLLLERATPGRAAYYVVSAALGLYFHYVFGFVILAHNAIVAWTWWVRGRRELGPGRWVAVQAATALLFLPWFVCMLRNLGGVNTNFVDMPWGRVGATFYLFMTGIPRPASYEGRILSESMLDNAHLIAAFLLVALPVALRGAIAAARSERAGPVLGMTFGVPVVLALGLAMAGSVRFTNDRYLGFLCPFWLLLMAAGMRSAPGRTWKIAAHLLVAALCVEALVAYYRIPEIANENWRDATRHVESRRGPGDLVCIHMQYMHIAYRYYARDAKDLLRLPETGRQEEFHAELAAAVRGRSRVWLVLGHHRGPDERVWQAVLGEWFVPAGASRRFPSPNGDPEVWEFVRR